MHPSTNTNDRPTTVAAPPKRQAFDQPVAAGRSARALSLAPPLFDTPEYAREVGERGLKSARASVSRMLGIFERALSEDCCDEHDIATFREEAIEISKALMTLEDVVIRGAEK